MNKMLTTLAGGLLLAPATLLAQPGNQNAPSPFGQASSEQAGPVTLLISGPVTIETAEPPGGAQRAAANESTPVDPRIRSIDLLTLIADVASGVDKEIIIDPRVRGPVSYTIGAEPPDYETLLAILRTNSLAAIESEQQIRIVPEAIMRSEPSRVLQEDDRRVSDHEIVTRIIDVDGISAAQMVPILRPMMPQGAQLGTVQGTSQLIVVDRYDNVRRLTRVIEELVANYEPPTED